ncbi:MAG: hypothetical protein ACXWIQ_02100 [Caldimonas sp.]
MNQPLFTLADGYAASRENAGYDEADELLRDLRGDNGEDRRSLAVGYVSAIRDSNADPLDGRTLLEYLRGESGEPLRLVGMGYVMAVRDAMSPPAGAVERAPSAQARARLQADAESVRSWLQRHASTSTGLAFALVRSALQDEPAGSRPQASRRSPWTPLAWFRAPHGFAKGMALATLCFVSLLVWQRHVAPDAAWTRSFEHDVELSQDAAQITRLLLEERRFEKDSFLNISNRDQIASYAKKWDESRAALAEAIARTRTLDLRDSDRQAIREIENDFQAYVSGYQRVLSRIRGGQIRTAEEANEQLAIYKAAVHRIEANGTAINARAVQRLAKLT